MSEQGLVIHRGLCRPSIFDQGPTTNNENRRYETFLCFSIVIHKKQKSIYQGKQYGS